MCLSSQAASFLKASKFPARTSFHYYGLFNAGATAESGAD